MHDFRSPLVFSRTQAASMLRWSRRPCPALKCREKLKRDHVGPAASGPYILSCCIPTIPSILLMLSGAVSCLVWQVLVLCALHRVLQQRIQSHHLHWIQRQLQTRLVVSPVRINRISSFNNIEHTASDRMFAKRRNLSHMNYVCLFKRSVDQLKCAWNSCMRLLGLYTYFHLMFKFMPFTL